MLLSPFLSLSILLLFLIMSVALVGWGCMLGRLCKIPFSVFCEKEEKILIGLFCLYLFAGIWNFFFPVNHYFSYGFLLAGGVFFFAGNRISKNDLNLFTLFFPLLFVSFSFTPVKNYDYYLYHADTLRWINEYAIVPGLANVHSRLGFNQFYFYFPAICETLLPGKGWSVANPFLAWIVFCYFWNMRRNKTYTCLALLSCGGIAYYSFSENLSSPTPDCLSNFLQLIILSLFMQQLKERVSGRFIFFMLLSVVAVLTKLSTSFLCIIVLLSVFILEKNKKGVLLNSLPVSFILGTVWCTRGVFLSGYMLYPISWPYFNTDWKLPTEILKKEQDGIIGCARWIGYNYIAAAHQPVSFWIEDWFSREGVPVIRRYLNGCILGWTLFGILKKRKMALEQWLVIFTIFSYLIFWFFTAPSERFATGILFFMLIYPFALLISCRSISSKQCFVLVCVLAWAFIPFARIKEWAASLTEGFTPRAWQRCYTVYTKSGLQVSFVPEADDKSNATDKPPLPTTPYFKPGLALRGASIQNGFMIYPSETDGKISIYKNVKENMNYFFQKRDVFAGKIKSYFPNIKDAQVCGSYVRIKQKTFIIVVNVSKDLRGKQLQLSIITKRSNKDETIFSSFSVSGKNCLFEENIYHGQVATVICIPSICTNRGKIELLCTNYGDEVYLESMLLQEDPYAKIPNKGPCLFNAFYDGKGPLLFSFDSGFSYQEMWGRWTEDTKAEFSLYIPGHFRKKNLKLSFNIVVFTHPQKPTCKVKFLTQGKVLHKAIFGKDDSSVTLKIPAEFNRKSRLPLTFKIADPISPKQLGISGDTRSLGIGIKEVRIDEM